MVPTYGWTSDTDGKVKISDGPRDWTQTTDIVVVEKDNKTALLIVITVPGDARVGKEKEKVD